MKKRAGEKKTVVVFFADLPENAAEVALPSNTEEHESSILRGKGRCVRVFDVCAGLEAPPFARIQGFGWALKR